ncbi:hypothetical protein F5Y07DRAFT_394550 [Xylaria sp. FL0933]|nr:hypothetical protein F5Y07DRAFT_394550 [Xylaria sp. FL0933]
MATPGKNKTNFKTYEASTRLLAAVIATTNVKLDYAELAKHVGGGATKDAINHRLRPIKQLAKMQATCIRKGEDPGDLPVDKGALAELVGDGATAVAMEHRMRATKQLAKEFAAKLDKKKKMAEESDESPAQPKKIQKLFGESTPSGLEWQFRDIKSLGKAQQEAVKKGENPATLPVTGTPSGRKKAAGANTPGSGATVRTPGTGARGRKRAAPAALAPLDSDSDTAVDPETPSKRPSVKKARTMAATTTPHKSNGSVAAPAHTPTNATASTPTGAVVTWATHTSSFLNGANPPAAMPSTEMFHNGAHMSTAHSSQYHVQNTPQYVTNPVQVVKKELKAGTNPFLGAMSVSAFGDGDDLEDGEI